MKKLHTPVSIHFLFGTRDSKPLIEQPMQNRLWSYMGGICRQMKIEVHEIGGVSNHAHLLLSLPPHISVSTAMQNVKSISSRWMNKTFYTRERNFRWQTGYLAHTIHASEIALYKSYIRNQHQLHQKTPFEAEFKRLEEVIRASGKSSRTQKPEQVPEPA
ncbi:MAG: IS200/IS605 family transposase [Balneolaceae bacterium]|nr:IS200/IS605 family transposase [Balneolaceae bacterium]